MFNEKPLFGTSEYLTSTPSALDKDTIPVVVDSLTYQIQRSSLEMVAASVKASLSLNKYRDLSEGKCSIKCSLLCNKEVSMTSYITEILNRFLFEGFPMKGFCIHQGPVGKRNRNSYLADLYVTKVNVDDDFTI